MKNTSKGPPPLAAKLMIGIAFLMLIAGGVGLIVKGVKTIEESRESRTWPTAPGKIVRSEILQETSSRRNRSDGRNKTTTSTSYRADIEYEFEINGEKHLGKRVTIAESITNRSIAQKIVDKYPRDRAVTVAYKPDDPSVCVLEPGSWGGSIVYFALGTFFLSIPVVLLIVMRKLNKPPTDSQPDPFADQGAWAE